MNKNFFLFSIDLEDVRDGVPNGNSYKERVVPNTLKYLDWLKKNKFKCTFFTVGTIAERYPDLIKEIINSGHEIACHTHSHIPLDKQTPDSFKRDINANINALVKAGALKVTGFRAPIFSLTQSTQWAYSVLEDAGIKYSSSVLPAKNPLYGWENFGIIPKKMNNGIIEIPISLNKFGPLTIPFAGGVYFRCLPFLFIKNSFIKSFQSNVPVLSYFHPYDLDTEQEKFMHAGINESKFYNFLMYYNRKNMIKRLDKILDLNVEIIPYEEYIKNLNL
jgi:polysaccharide deacetylase family protein (PEP-CTERM system associated)